MPPACVCVGSIRDVQHHPTAQTEGKQLQGGPWDDKRPDEHEVCCPRLATRHNTGLRRSRCCALLKVSNHGSGNLRFSCKPVITYLVGGIECNCVIFSKFLRNIVCFFRIILKFRELFQNVIAFRFVSYLIKKWCGAVVILGNLLSKCRLR